MKNPRLLSLLIILFAAFSVSVNAETLCEFSQTKYTGWTYTRSSVTLNTTNISTNKINVFKGSDGADYTLVSPEMSVEAFGSVTVSTLWYATQYTNSNYDINKAGLTYEILVDNEVAVSKKVSVTAAELTHNEEVQLTLPVGINKFKLRIAAWDADATSASSIRKVSINSAESAVDDIEASNKYTLSTAPNELHVSVKTPCNIIIYDINGKTITNSSLNIGEYSFNIASGLYVVNGDDITQKIFIKP